MYPIASIDNDLAGMRERRDNEKQKHKIMEAKTSLQILPPERLKTI